MFCKLYQSFKNYSGLWRDYVLKNKKENVFRNIFFVYKYIKEFF